MEKLRLTLGAALAADRLEDFVRQEEAHGVELDIGSDFERALALLLVQRGLSPERHHGRGPGKGLSDPPILRQRRSDAASQRQAR
jgi:hypothetical protein